MDHLNFLEMFREPDAEAIVSNFWVWRLRLVC